MKFIIKTNGIPEKKFPITIDIPKDIWKQRYNIQGTLDFRWDVDECQECGWISVEHLGAIINNLLTY